MDFLEKVAQRLYNDHRHEMEKQVIVLPSRRAGLYLSRFLSRLDNKPQWAPGMVTVNELFASFSTLRQASHETLIFELYRSYKKIVTEPMSFDDFWAWGEVIISDFSDIDLYMVDAQKLYSNIAELKDIDERFGGLDTEQVEIIRQFWASFTPKYADSEARKKFQSVWKLLLPLYNDFADSLREKGYAGEGMLCRAVATEAMNGSLRVPDGIRWHIAGLNALNECEKRLFRHLKDTGKAKFYWDDDHSFMTETDHKASVFIRENIRVFGNELVNEEETLKKDPHNRWTIINTPSDTAQAKMIPRIISEAAIIDDTDLTDTAIILADEKLLSPVLTSIPAEISDVNVTMGHPFRLTTLYSFIRQIFIMARYSRREGETISFRTEDVLGLLRHQYFRLFKGTDADSIAGELISGNMIRTNSSFLCRKINGTNIFDIPEGGTRFIAYLHDTLETLEAVTFTSSLPLSEMSVDREYIRMALAETGKIRNLLNEYSLDLKIDTAVRLADKVLKKLIVPFSGEPLRGIQVMGVLETRALEFRRIIFLSLNEGIFPDQGYDNTFIPYNIRRAFGLPTVNEHESVYSYHFFRLLRKPERGWFLYNSTTQGLNSGEMSRYLVRMRFDPACNPVFQTMHISVGRSSVIPATLKRKEEHSRALFNMYKATEDKEKYLSPSAINTWLNCRMKFYFTYVCGMPEEEKLEKEIDQRRFGNILHNVMMDLYSPMIGKGVTNNGISGIYSDNELIRKTIIENSSAEMKWSVPDLLAGKGVIIVDVLERYIKDILKYDKDLESLSLIHLEDKFACQVNAGTGATGGRVLIGGRVDRVDITGELMRVVDYKTGTPKNNDVRSIEELFSEENEKRNEAVLQTLIYCSVLASVYPGKVIMPAIYWVQQISAESFSPAVNIEQYGGMKPGYESWKEMMKSFNDCLGKTLDDIFSESEDFRMTGVESRCTYCNFRQLCRK